MDNKVYVAVKAQFNPDGKLTPLSIRWEDDNEYFIDKILDVCRAASLKAGGTGMRYRVRIGPRETYLYYETDKWFVERR